MIFLNVNINNRMCMEMWKEVQNQFYQLIGFNAKNNNNQKEFCFRFPWKFLYILYVNLFNSITRICSLEF